MRKEKNTLINKNKNIMGMSTRIEAFIPDTDTEYQKHAKVLLVCHQAGLKELPPETAKYFGSKHVNPELLDEKLSFTLTKGVHYKDYTEDMIEGYEIFVDKLPKEISKIRVYNSY